MNNKNKFFKTKLKPTLIPSQKKKKKPTLMNEKYN